MAIPPYLNKQIRLIKAELDDYAQDAAAEAESWAEQAQLAVDARYFGSAALPLFNGEVGGTAVMGRFVTTGWGNMGGTGTAAFFAGPSTACIIWDAPLEQYDVMNKGFPLLAQKSATTLGRTFALRYYSAGHFTSGNRRKFEVNIRGESNRTAIALSGYIPPTARGPFAIFPVFDSSAMIAVDVYDIGASTWYMGTPTAPTAGWEGAIYLSGELAIGAAYDAALGVANTTSRQAVQWARGAIRDVFFADGLLSTTDRESIVNGTDIATVVAAAGGTLRIHFPLVSGGTVSTATSGARTVTLAVEGSILPGPNLRRQTTATYLIVDRLPWPGHVILDPETGHRRIKLTGKTAGLTGRMFCDVISTETFIRVTPRFEVFPTVSGNTFSVIVDLPKGVTDWQQIQLRYESDLTVVGSTNPHILQSQIAEAVGQSETAIGLDNESTDLAGNTATSIRPAADLSKIWFATGKTISPDTGSTLSSFGLITPALGISSAPDQMVIIANEFVRRGVNNAMIACQATSGTSLISLMDDSIPSRKSSDYKAILSLAANRGSRGELLCNGRVIDWDAFFPQQAGIIQNVLQVFLNGRNYPNANVTTVNFWLGDGSLSRKVINVLAPPNRLTTSTGAGTSDSGFEGQQRDDYRNWAHDIGYVVGCERIAHNMQSEAAGVLGTTEQSHPGSGAQGGVEYAYYLAQNLLLSLGKGNYRGPRFVESVRAGSALDKVIVKFGAPRPYPGLGIVTVSNQRVGYSLATTNQPIPAYPTEPLYTKIAGGNPRWNFEAKITNAGTRSLTNVLVAVIISADEVELTLSTNYVIGETTIWTLDGGPGRYSSSTVNQEDWRAGILHYGGVQMVDATTQPTAPLGYSVAGSSQGVVLA